MIMPGIEIIQGESEFIAFPIRAPCVLPLSARDLHWHFSQSDGDDPHAACRFRISSLSDCAIHLVRGARDDFLKVRKVRTVIVKFVKVCLAGRDDTARKRSGVC